MFIVGATGVVGQEMLDILGARAFPCRGLRLMGSPRSIGREIPTWLGPRVVEPVDPGEVQAGDLVLLATPAQLSRTLAPTLAASGATVIDNSSAFRLDPDVPLVVPEINATALGCDPVPGRIIANPNCSTIIALMAVAPLHRAATVVRMVVSTYQAVSGAGRAAMEELEQQVRDAAADRPLTTTCFGRPCLHNVFSHDSDVGADGRNGEERKLVLESRRILAAPDLGISATCIRVPVLRTHCESINLTFARPLPPDRARTVLAEAPGVKVVDDRDGNQFPEPRLASGQDDVLVGRIRADDSQAPGMGLDLFVAGDQLRKGAALNAIQIAEAVTGCSATRSAATG